MPLKSRLTSLPVFAVLLVLPGALQACSVPGSAPGTALSPAARTAAASPTGKACGWLPAFDKAAADEIMDGSLTIPPFGPVVMDPRRDGNIDWNQNPFRHPTWQQDFQSGGWIEQLISGYLAGGPGAAAYRARAETLIKGWLGHVPVGRRDPRELICLSEGFPGQKWIDDQIGAGVSYLAAHWQGPWNHGLVQDLKIMQIACAYPASAFGGDDLRWRRTTDRQILSSFRDSSRLGPSVDAQGVVNEQATGYERFVRNLWDGGERELKACGYALPSAIAERIAKMPAFLAEATQPDGNLVQIGDTYQESGYSPGRDGAPARLPLVAVYRAGYVFGRDRWGPAGTFYSLRFGPARQVHGHDDHLGVTYYSRGRNLIIDAGHVGYEDDAYRRYLRSPEAASTFLSATGPFYASQATALVTDRAAPASQYYQLTDQATGGRRTRSVYVHDGPDFMLVLDHATGNGGYQQLWHLDPSLTVTSATSAGAVAIAPAASPGQAGVPATVLHLVRVRLPGAGAAGPARVVRGRTAPAYQGWVSRQALRRIPAPVVIMNSHGAGHGRGATMLTLIAATAPGVPVSATAARAGNNSYAVTVRIGGATTSVRL